MKSLFIKISIPFIKSLVAISIALILTISPILTPSVFAAVMTSGNYQIERDSINFAGTNSSSAGKDLNDTAGELGTGNLEGVNYDVSGGYQQPSPASTASVGDSSSQSSGGSYSGIRYPVNILNFIATPLEKSINLSWDYPIDSNIQSVRIVRSDKFFPLDINEGDIIFEGNTKSVIDYNVKPGVLYYYAIFAKNISGEYSSGVLSQAIIISKGEIVETYPQDIFENIIDAQNVDPVLQSLTLADFDFIQDDIKIAHAGNTVSIDGTKVVTISLDYKKVPEILKTIAITLIDPDDSEKIFTFILRVNKEKTAYQAVLGALNKSGEYKLKAIILDYKNQGLKRFNGSLKVSVFEPVDYLLKNKTIYGWNYIILLVIFISIVLLSVYYYKKRKAYDK